MGEIYLKLHRIIAIVAIAYLTVSTYSSFAIMEFLIESRTFSQLELQTNQHTRSRSANAYQYCILLPRQERQDTQLYNSTIEAGHGGLLFTLYQRE